MKLILVILFFTLQSFIANAVEHSSYFKFDSAELSYNEINRLNKYYNFNNNKDIYLHGYADSTGPETYNFNLSNRRANNLKQYLIKNFSIPEEKIKIIAHGETNNKKKTSLNRRVDISFNEETYIERRTANTYGEANDTPATNSYSPMDDANYNVHFETDYDYLSRREMEAIRYKFATYSGGIVKLYGYADPRGTAKYNLDLSLRRATNVYKYMINYLGIPKENIKYYYLGEDGTEGRQLRKKRRVSIYWDTPKYKQPITTAKETYLEPQPVIKPEPTVEPVITAAPPVIEEVPEAIEVEQELASNSVEEEFDSKFWLAPFIGLQHSSAYYEGDLPFEHGKNTFLNFGLRAGYHFKPKWHIEGYAYYLPTEVDEHISQVDFKDTKIINYENNLYGINLERDFKNKEKYRWGAQVGYSSHIIGSIEGLGTDPSIPASKYGFNKFNHHGINLGLYYDRYLSKKWKLNTEATYILPLKVDDVSDAQPGLWYQGGIGLMRWHKDSRKWQYGVDYRVYYHQSDLTFKSNQFTDAEYFIQTLMLGLKRTF